MTIPHRTERKKHLDRLFAEVKKFNADDELASHLSKYLCILVSGYIESSVREIMYDYAKNKSHQNVANFVLSKLKRLGNPKIDPILQLVGSFSVEWRKSVENEIDDELKDAVDSIVTNRNQIAHGVDIGITFGRINDYYEKTVKVIKIIETRCI